MTWWRKASPADTGSHNIDGWIQMKSIWRKASAADEANSAASANPWVIDGWLKIKSAWRHEGSGIWTRIFGSSDLPTPKIPFPELYFIWPDGFPTIDSPINGSKMFVTRGAWTEEPNEFRIIIQERAPGGTYESIYDFTRTYTEYFDSDATDRFPSNANDATRPVISKAKTRSGYEFRARVDVTNPTGFTNFYTTEAIKPRIDFYVNDFSVYDETSNGATFSWTFAVNAVGNTVNSSLDIYSQKIYIYDESGNLVLSQNISVGTTTYTLSNQLLTANNTYSVELEVIGQDGYATTEDSTISFGNLQFTTVVEKPIISVSPSFTLQSGQANKVGSVYRVTSGTWTNNPTQYRYILELNNINGTEIAWYPSSTGWTSDLYYDHTFTSVTSNSVSAKVIANNGTISDPAYATQSVGPITEPTYIITYNGNNGTPARNSDEVIVGNSVSLPSASRSGYIFDGWYTAVVGGTYVGTTNSLYTPSSTITLYARWSIITYSITWNAFGGTVNANGQSTYVTPVNAGSSITAPGATRQHYDLAYWRSPLAGGDPTIVSAGNSYTPTSDIEFYAIWTIKQYTVDFSEAGGSLVTDRTVDATSVITLPTTTRSGFTFDGWYTAAVGGTFVGSGGSQYTVNASITLYARWTAIQYTVSWLANGGSVSPTSSSGTLGSVINPVPTPTRADHTFLYWRDSTSAFNFSYQINPGGSWTINGNISFYAWWSINQYTVTYNANGGSVSPTSSTVNAGSSVTLPTPTRSGFTFDGWYTATTGGSFVGNGGSSYTPSSSVTIYARWSTVQYTITWNANGGSVSPTSSVVNAGSSVTAPTPTRSGFTFSFWRSPLAGGDPTIVSAGNSYTPTGNIEFYAIWTQNVPGSPSGVTLSRNQSSWNGTSWTWNCTWSAPTSGGTVAYYEAYREVGTGTVGNATLTSVNHTSNVQTNITTRSTTFSTATQANNRADAYVRACNSGGCSAWVSGNVG